MPIIKDNGEASKQGVEITGGDQAAAKQTRDLGREGCKRKLLGCENLVRTFLSECLQCSNEEPNLYSELGEL